MIHERLYHYACLMRLNKPIGIFLLLWPTLWALWLASAGWPDHKILFIFVTGVVLMRSAGCVMNDFADRNFDGHVERTRERPLASGKVSAVEALILFGFLCLLAFFLVLLCNSLTILLAFVGCGLAMIYPFLKRVTHLPQLGLSVAFMWGVLMAFAAVTGSIDAIACGVFFTATLWPIIYDTIYAMVDREEDIKIGIKSTAILFGKYDKFIIALLQLIFLTMLVGIGILFQLKIIFYVSLGFVACLFVYQQWLIRDRDREKCFQAFLNNNWVGVIIFMGILLSYFS